MNERIYGVWIWALAVIAGLLMLGLVAWKVRRWMMLAEESDAGPVFTLQELREMKDRGAISDAEFEQMRAGLLEAFGRAGDSNPADRQRNDCAPEA